MGFHVVQGNWHWKPKWILLLPVSFAEQRYKYQTPAKYPPVDNYHQVYKKVYLLLWTSVYLGNGTQNSLIELDLGSLEGDNWEKFAF